MRNVTLYRKTKSNNDTYLCSLKPINLLGGMSLVLVNTEERQDKGVELGVLELPLHGTPISLPLDHVLLVPEEMLPVGGNVGEDSSQAPHVS